MSERRQVYELVLAFFKGDEKKAKIWMRSRNTVLLGGMTPGEMLDLRPGKLLKIVKQQLEENER